MFIASSFLPASWRLQTHAQSPTPISLTLAAVVDRAADAALSVGQHRRAEQLAHLAAELREVVQ